MQMKRCIVPHNIPQPKGQPVKVTTYAGLKLCRNILDGKAVTGTLHFVNQTLVDWYAKKQAAAKTTTYGAEELRSTGAYDYVHIPGKINPADILACSYQNVWNMLMPILFWHGNTGELIEQQRSVKLILLDVLLRGIYIHNIFVCSLKNLSTLTLTLKWPRGSTFGSCNAHQQHQEIMGQC